MLNKIKSFFAKYITETLILIAFMVIGFYLSIFNNGISTKNEDWGTFGDYFGGILNPITSAFAFYLVAKTYNLQKESQSEQIALAALTANLNSKLIRAGLLRSEKESIFNNLNDLQRKVLFYLEVKANIFNLKFDEIFGSEEFIKNAYDYLSESEYEILGEIIGKKYNNKSYFHLSCERFFSIKEEIKVLEYCITELELKIEKKHEIATA